jgi:hypothetical protein
MSKHARLCHDSIGYAVQAVQQPRIACAEQLLELCDEHCQLEHRRTLDTGGHPPTPLIHRLLALIPQHLHACAWHADCADRLFPRSCSALVAERCFVFNMVAAQQVACDAVEQASNYAAHLECSTHDCVDVY